jgi:hypothetical protein
MAVGDSPHIEGVVDELREGVFTAVNKRDRSLDVKCYACVAEPEAQANCTVCAGRGAVDNVPYPDHPWDQVAEGLWVGGHGCQPANGIPGTVGEVWVRDEFDLVISLHRMQGDDAKRYGPSPHVATADHKMMDSDLDPDHHTAIDTLAELAVDHLRRGDRVLVRCMGGINRSSLVAALAMVKMGWPPEAAINRIREVRSPWCLFNQSFVDYILESAP